MEVINNEKKIDLGLALGDENIHPNVQVNSEFLIFNSSMRIFRVRTFFNVLGDAFCLTKESQFSFSVNSKIRGL